VTTLVPAKSLFQTSYNCWRVRRLKRGSLLIDCANFYRAVHSAVRTAEHSIFIIGWEVDSGTYLLRGKEAEHSEIPVTALDLLKWKATQNPQLQIYILRWDSSVAFLNEREPLPEYAWSTNSPENLHICLDNTVPIGGSHHQKIVLVDDELVMTGGMDIARQRWDDRTHSIHNPLRNDANGPYGPYHDVQMMMDGPIVQDFAELVRWRWRQCSGYEAVPARPQSKTDGGSANWPAFSEPFFKDMSCAIARTIPYLEDQDSVQEIRRMYQDLIEQAEDFIYIENQFLSYKQIALALNRQLRAKPKLRILLVSSYNPQGLFESEGLWAARIDFKNILQENIDPSRVRMACSGIPDQNGQIHYKRVHSKVFIVDDRYLVVASSNINNRSMTLDTECDVILQAQDAGQRRCLFETRNDLIGEHTSRTAEQVRQIFEQGGSIDDLLNAGEKNGYSLREIDDTKFTNQNFQLVAQRFADPEEPLIPYIRSPLSDNNQVTFLRNPGKAAVLGSVLFLLIAAGTYLLIRAHGDWFHEETLKKFMESSRNSPWSLLLVCLIYIAGGFVFFPVTVLSLMTAAVFGSLLGPVYGMCGALSSAAVVFSLGRWAGFRGIRKFAGERVKKIDHHFQRTGILGIALLRFLPIAPFSLVNLAAGISSVHFSDFMLGSFLGFLPAFIAKGLVGDSLAQIFFNPSPRAILYLAIGVAVWLALAVGSYFLARRWQRKQP
jgi:phospholipase D1/2